MKTLRLAPGSHREPWALPCREAIVNAPNATCSMEKVHPECNSMLDNVAVSFDVQAGDMLLWDRWLFHRSEVMRSDDPKARYSVRFIPQGARVREGVTSAHPSVKVGEEFRGPYYPQVWPSAVPEEVEAIHKGLESDMSLSPMTMATILWEIVVSKWLKAKVLVDP